MKQPRDYPLMLQRKAADDLIAADAIMQTGKALDTVGFHAQQATEKSRKAILSFHGVEYPRTHDLAQLLTLVLDFMPQMMEFSDRILPLTPYAIQVRYADEDLLLEKGAIRAFEAATKVYGFTVRQLGLGHEQPEDWYID
jgi:HEPN domain-containing protein